MSDKTHEQIRKEKWKKAWHLLIETADPDFINGMTIGVLNGCTSPIKAWVADPLECMTGKPVALETDSDRLRLLEASPLGDERLVGTPQQMLDIDRAFRDAFDYDESFPDDEDDDECPL